MGLSRALKRPLVWSTQVLLTPTKTNTKYSIKQTSKKTCITSFRISSPFTLGPLAKEMTTFSIGLKAKCRCYCGYPESSFFLKWVVLLFVFYLLITNAVWSFQINIIIITLFHYIDCSSAISFVMFFYFDMKGLSWVFYRLMQIYIKQNEFTEGFIHLAIELHIKHLQGISFYFLIH